MQGDKGFPDLVLAKQRRVIFAELKSATGKLSQDQEDWMTELESPVGGSHETYVWRPDDIDEIGKVLGPDA
jgi:hypothetical protein